MKGWWLLPLVPLTFAGLYGAHRLLVRMEERGWIYYRKGGSSSSVGASVHHLQSLLEPGQRHAVEERRAERRARVDLGAPPEAPDED